MDEVESLEVKSSVLDKKYQQYYAEANKKHNRVPNVEGMSGMDAIAILENLGIKVKVTGNGKVKRQSVKDANISEVKLIVLELS